jgi:curved DNA-binding protein CbpA
MKYFSHCKTIEEVKAPYKELAKKNHPDRGGDTEIMQRINTEYDFACSHILKGENLT